ncbi:efflux transporter outer membrane subunit [Burkholderia gladioli]|uniref:efflux transporter outer membrane subunit n=1 Tax=Burkholderia gladioli TaxID=28095 RepID=UPI001641AF35|nr:efflux transporter outer membrane subunit [Burkholderia gladioli]
MRTSSILSRRRAASAPRARRPSSRVLLACLLAASCGLGGCGGLTRSEYRRPALDVPAQWNAGQDAAAAAPVTGSSFAASEPWWRRFDDPQLDALIERALRSNNNLAAAAMRLYSAQLQSRLTDTNLTPDVTVSGSGSAARNLTRGGSTLKSYTTTTNVSYELDFWGHLARQRDAAAFEAQATEYDRRAAALTLVGQTATAYWQIAALKRIAATTQESIDTAERTLKFVHIQHVAGEASDYEESQARSTLKTLEGELSQIVAQLEAQRNALAIIFDQSPEHREPELDSLPIRAMPAMPAVVPADMLAHRPDLQAAETRLRETLAQADAQRLAFYPSFSLFASVGTGGTSTTLADILRNPLGTLGATLSLPFIQWNTAELTIKSSKATFDTAVINFRQTFYQALSDTRSAWVASVQSEREVRSLKEAVEAARRAESLAEIRYRSGDTSLTDWLNLQQTRQQADVQLEQAVYSQYVNALTLFLALGGDPASQALGVAGAAAPVQGASRGGAGADGMRLAGKARE